MKSRKVIIMILKIVVPFMFFALALIILGYDPLIAYRELWKGAFVGTYNIGTSLEKFGPIFLTGMAFLIASKVKFFHLGIEGSLYMGALFAAGSGLIPGLPKAIHLPLALGIGMLAGALWSTIPGILRAYFNVNESCVTMMMNYVAIYFSSYMIVNVWSARDVAAKTLDVMRSARFTRILPPSRITTALFLVLFTYLVVYWLLHKTNLGYKMNAVGTNPYFSEYTGISAKKMVLCATFIAGAIGGMAGAIETLGTYNSMWDNFSVNTAFDGMLASLISRNDMRKLPIFALTIAFIKAGALGMERFSGVPKSVVDTLIPILILMLSIDGLFDFVANLGFRKRKSRTSAQA